MAALRFPLRVMPFPDSPAVNVINPLKLFAPLKVFAAASCAHPLAAVLPKADAFDAVPVRAAVMVPAEKLPLASRNTMVEPVFALVAFDVTVKVALLD